MDALRSTEGTKMDSETVGEADPIGRSQEQVLLPGDPKFWAEPPAPRRPPERRVADDAG